MINKRVKQTIILVDNKDKLLGYENNVTCHTGKGKHHRAIVIAIYNKKRELLLQKRKHAVFDSVWDLSGATHPLHLPHKDETYNEAAVRCAKVEWNINKIRFRKIGAFNYFKRDGKNCENEHCAIMLAKYDGKVKSNSDVSYGFEWRLLTEVKSDAKRNPNSYAVWALKALPKISLKL